MNSPINKKIRIGTRGSKLALWQAHHVQGLLKKNHPDLEIEIVVITTTGDQILDKPLADIGGKGLFLKEIEEALLDNKIDCAVHSLKDVPAKLPDGLKLSAYLERENPNDVLISRDHKKFAQLAPGSVIGSSSIRRVLQLNAIRPDLVFKDMRGNVDTRIKKMNDGFCDAIILACAGVKRLGMQSVITEELSDIVCAVGQGAIAIETRTNDSITQNFISKLNHQPTEMAVCAERKVLETLEGDCKTPLGAKATITGQTIKLTAFLGEASTKKIIKKDISFSSKNTDYNEAHLLALELKKEIAG